MGVWLKGGGGGGRSASCVCVGGGGGCREGKGVDSLMRSLTVEECIRWVCD